MTIERLTLVLVLVGCGRSSAMSLMDTWSYG